MAPRKVDWALAARAVITQFAEAVERIAEIDAIYTDSGYDAGGENPIVDADLEGHDITAAQLAEAHWFATQLDAFLIPIITTAINGFRNMS